jgi:hypothetical protein
LKDIAQIDQREREEMKAEKIDLLALKPDQETLEFVDPCKGSFIHKALFVHGWVKMALAPTLGAFAIALIFRDIRSYTAIPEQFACLFCVECTICIKVGVRIREFKLIQLRKQIFEPIGQLVTIIMVPSNHFTGAKNEAIGVCYWNDIAGFGLFSTLIGDCFAPFFAALWLPSRLRIAKFSS